MKRVFSATTTQANFDRDIDKYLSDNKVWVESVYSDYDKDKNVVEISVEIDGDWKHDHLYLRHVMTKNGYTQVYEMVTEEDGDDAYSSIHTFKYGVQ